jgi:hypothetical protein
MAALEDWERKESAALLQAKGRTLALGPGQVGVVDRADEEFVYVRLRAGDPALGGYVERRLPHAKLTREQREALFPVSLPDTPAVRTARFMRAVAGDPANLALAAQAVLSLGDAPLAEHYAAWVRKREKVDRETAAARSWPALEQAVAPSPLSAEQAAKALADLQAWEDRHGGTDWALAQDAVLQQWRLAARRAARPLLLLNGGFEEGVEGWAPDPKNQGQPAAAGDGVKAGKGALNLPAQTGVLQQLRLKTGQSCLVSGWVKALQPDGFFRVCLDNWQSESGVAVEQSGAAEWTKWELEVRATRDDHVLGLRNESSSGVVLVDEISVEPLCAEAAPQPRDGGWTTFGGHSYKLVRKRAPWLTAQRLCRELGGHLACVSSAEENAFLSRLAREYGEDVWLGLTDDGPGGGWRWLSGEGFSFLAWAPNRPASPNCGPRAACLSRWHNFAWADAPLARPCAFICEWEPR